MKLPNGNEMMLWARGTQALVSSSQQHGWEMRFLHCQFNGAVIDQGAFSSLSIFKEIGTGLA